MIDWLMPGMFFNDPKERLCWNGKSSKYDCRPCWLGDDTLLCHQVPASAWQSYQTYRFFPTSSSRTCKVGNNRSYGIKRRSVHGLRSHAFFFYFSFLRHAIHERANLLFICLYHRRFMMNHRVWLTHESNSKIPFPLKEKKRRILEIDCKPDSSSCTNRLL